MSEPTIYNEIALKIKGQQKEIEKLRKELKLAEENEEYWHNAFSDLEDEYARLKDALSKIPRAKMEYDLELEDYKSRCEKADEKIKKHLYDKKFLNHIHTNEQMLNIVSNILNGKGDE